jgi:3-oxoacyl-[acyl-carrier-protein] synthase-3
LSDVKKRNVGILGLGVGIPETVLTNADLEKMVDTTDEWIMTRTGIRERRILADDQNPSDIAVEAAQKALLDAGVEASEIDGIIYCSYTQEYIMPPTSGLLHGKLGIPGKCISFDLNAACSGFVNGLQTAWSLVQSGLCRKVLLLGVDCNSRMVDYSDRATCVLFGDGAGAVVIGEIEESRGIRGNFSGTDGGGALLIKSYGGAGAYPFSKKEYDMTARYMQMNGREVYKFAVKALAEAVDLALADAGMKNDEIDLLVPHQANLRIIESAIERFKIPASKTVMNMDVFGNTSAASIPLALNTARQDGRLKQGTTCALVAFGAGLTYAASILKW